MMQLYTVSSLIGLTFATLYSSNETLQKPLNDYVNADEDVYTWRDTGVKFTTLMGGTAHKLNVTSLQWLNDTAYKVTGGSSIWTHEVIVIEPKDALYRNVSLFYVSSAFAGCNDDKPITNAANFDLEMADIIAHDSKALAVVAYQVPNCRIIFEDDPEQRERDEDPLVAWSLKRFLDTKGQDPLQIIVFPMVKASFQIMRAAEDFIKGNGLGGMENGWIAAGASKRGWSSWLVGGVTCEKCVNIIGITPLVPILPALTSELHRQWRSYGGFSFAFKDYMDAGLIDNMDEDFAIEGIAMVDPLTFGSRLARIPKLAIVSSDDEFMQMDWTNIWYDQMTQHGETHLLITPNSEHAMVTNIHGILSTMTSMVKSIAAGVEERPHFNHTYDATNGEIVVTIPPQFQPTGVFLRHAQTMDKTRRDFRWLRAENDRTPACTWPWVKIPISLMGGGNCVQLTLWHGQELKESAPGVFRATPPEPTDDQWTGYYIEIYFAGDTEQGSLFLDNHFAWSTPGYVWPNTQPYAECNSKEGTCISQIV